MLGSQNESQVPSKATRKPRAAAVCVVILFLLCAGFFHVTVRQRAPHFGHATISLAGWTTGGTCLFATNWYREGAFKNWFCMYWEPASIEASQLDERTPYVSFPPGAIVPVYILAKLRGREPTPALVMGYNLFNHFCVTFTLALTAFLVLRRLRYGYTAAMLLSPIPAFLYLWLPSPFYEHQMGFFSDQAIMLPFVLYLLLEVVRDYCEQKRTKRLLSLLQGAIAFWGITTDWLFAFIAASLYLVRFSRGEFGHKPLRFLKRSAAFSLPILLGLSLFLLQLHHLGAFDQLSERFTARTGIKVEKEPSTTRPSSPSSAMPQKAESTEGSASGIASLAAFTHFTLDTLFWNHHVPKGFGQWGKRIILLSSIGLMLALAAAAVQRVRRRPISPGLSTALMAMFLTLAPCFLYLHIFGPHSAYFLHDFSTLKFAVPIALAPFVLLPAITVHSVRARTTNKTSLWRAIDLTMALAALLGAGLFVQAQDEERAAKFTTFTAQADPKVPGKANLEHVPPGQFIRTHTTFEDVVFSTGFSTAGSPPQIIVYSMKVVHKIQSIEEIHHLVKNIDADYTVNLFIKQIPGDHTGFGISPLAAKAYEVIEKDGMQLRKIRKDDFLELYRELSKE